MANPMPPKVQIGTIGELLVQLRLLQYGVQAAPPLKDSGNDLVALKGDSIRTVQVKTRTKRVPPWPDNRKLYHLLAVVRLCRAGTDFRLDQSEIFLVPKPKLQRLRRAWEALRKFRVSERHVAALFQEAVGPEWCQRSTP